MLNSMVGLNDMFFWCLVLSGEIFECSDYCTEAGFREIMTIVMLQKGYNIKILGKNI